VTVRTPTEDEKRRAEQVSQGILPDLPDDEPRPPGTKGAAEAKRRFGKP
jgi:hypothetical protein